MKTAFTSNPTDVFLNQKRTNVCKDGVNVKCEAGDEMQSVQQKSTLCFSNSHKNS